MMMKRTANSRLYFKKLQKDEGKTSHSQMKKKSEKSLLGNLRKNI
jgi:hypothetical protein